MSEQNGKMVVLCNSDSAGVMPTFIKGASGVGIGEQVLLFFCPNGANVLLKGELEVPGQEGAAGSGGACSTILNEGGRIILCELALEAKGIKKEDLRDPRIEILNAPSFLLDAQGAGLSLTF
jgi:predicted peroxiredoxin